MSRQDNAIEDAEQLEFQTGRRAPYSQVGDWVMLASIRHPAKVLYWALSAHINSSRDDSVVWPTQDALAEMLGFSRRDKIKPFLDELVAIDAISIKKTGRYVGGLRRERSVYVVNQSPPIEYAGLESLRDFYTARKARIEAAQTEPDEDETPGQPQVPETGYLEEGSEPDPAQVPEMGYLDSPHLGYLVSTPNGVPNKKNYNQTNLNEDEAGGASRRPPGPPAARTAGDVESVVTNQLTLVSNQQTARAKTAHAPVKAERKPASTIAKRPLKASRALKVVQGVHEHGPDCLCVSTGQPGGRRANG